MQTRQMGNLGDALKEAAEVVTMSPSNLAVYLNIARIRQNAKAFHGAETNLLKAQTLSPNSAAPLMALAILYQSE
jgi:Flp pilus assembly protein TadD